MIVGICHHNKDIICIYKDHYNEYLYINIQFVLSRHAHYIISIIVQLRNHFMTSALLRCLCFVYVYDIHNLSCKYILNQVSLGLIQLIHQYTPNGGRNHTWIEALYRHKNSIPIPFPVLSSIYFRIMTLSKHLSFEILREQTSKTCATVAHTQLIRYLNTFKKLICLPGMYRICSMF